MSEFLFPVQGVAPGPWYIVQPVAPATAPAGSLVGPNFLNGWSNFVLPDSTYSPLRYRIDRATKMVRIVGSISGGNFGSAAFILPAAFRPVDDIVVLVPSNDGTVALACQITASTGAVIPLAAIVAPASGTITDITSTGGTISITAPTGPTTNVDLPASGVGAATYGDGTHVSQVTVNAEGIVTAAANVAITAGAGTISDITSTGGSITVTAPTGPTTNVDLPTSGVSAGTYGDSGHVGQFHVNADGIVTSASQVAIGGGGGSTLIFSSTLGADTATIDTGANAIGSTFNLLEVFIYSRTADAAVGGTLALTFNGSTGGYTRNIIQVVNTTVTGASSVGQASISLDTHGNTGLAGAYGVCTMVIPDYASSTAQKTCTFHTIRPDSTAANQAATEGGGSWASSGAAINQITLATISAVNLKAGTSMFIYGR